VTPHGITMARLYGVAVLLCVAALAVQQCREPRRAPHSVAISVAGVPPTTTELAARLDMLEMRMESRDDAIEALLWLSEQDRKDGCR
jgi:hypothetical protein